MTCVCVCVCVYRRGAQAKTELLKSGLDKDTLKRIWFMADQDKDGMLDADEYIIAVHLAKVPPRTAAIGRWVAVRRLPYGVCVSPGQQTGRAAAGPAAHGPHAHIQDQLAVLRGDPSRGCICMGGVSGRRFAFFVHPIMAANAARDDNVAPSITTTAPAPAPAAASGWGALWSSVTASTALQSLGPSLRRGPPTRCVAAHSA